MKTILFPTQFSGQAKERLAFACRLAHRSGAKIIVVHAFQIEEAYNHPSAILLNQALDKYEQSHLESFFQLKESVTEHLDEKTELEFHTFVGHPAQVSLMAAQQFRPNAIVMGGALYGKVSPITEYVIKRAHCPVLALPQNPSFRALPPLVYATNFRKEDQRIIDKLLVFSRTFSTPLHCIHIKQDTSPIDMGKLTPWQNQYAEEIQNGLIQFEIVYQEEVPNKLDRLWSANRSGLWVMPFERASWWKRFLPNKRNGVGVNPAHSPVIALNPG
jgi:nucleotide-binding universal stress UspA family protein